MESLRSFIGKTVKAIDLEVLYKSKFFKRFDGTYYLDTGSITFLVFQNKIIIGHHCFIKELHIDFINESLKIKLNYEIEYELTFKDIKDKTDLFNYMIQHNTPFVFDDLEKIREIVSVLLNRFLMRC